MKLIDTVRSFISTHTSLHEGQTLTVALSGGPDSVALLHCLLALGFDVRAAHCNFHLRGTESNRDEEFVRQMCESLGVQLLVKDFDTKACAEQTGKSIEMAARDLRYEWFAQIADTIAVAHHRDDQAETLLLNLTRGSGLSGLTGMQPERRQNALCIVRPLLCVTRKEIMEYLTSIDAKYIIDSTNALDDCRRNVIRHHVMPRLEELNPKAVTTISDTCTRLAEAERLLTAALNDCVRRCFRKGQIDKQALMSTPAPRTVLYEILRTRGFNSAQVDRILKERDGQPGQVYMSDKWRLLRDRNSWVLSQKKADGKVNVSMSMHCFPAAEYTINREPSVAAFDMEKIGDSLMLRHIEPGDRFTPLGMSGSRLVSDFLTDLHVNLFEREQQLVLVSDGQIAWVVGRRISNKFAISQATKTVLEVRVK